MSNLCTCVECMPDSQEPEMNNEDKMWEDFGAAFPHADRKIFVVWQVATEKCAAIKDAEIAELKIQVAGWKYNWNESTDREIQLQKEVASRDLMIKELREAFQDLLDEGVLKSSIINEALAKSEHHNFRALEKMLLEARIEEFERVEYDQHYQVERGIELQKQLAELNKE